MAKKNSRSVRLDLTVEEAQTLFDVCCSIGGDPTSSRRQHTNSIKQMLAASGKINPDVKNSNRDMNPSHRYIYFE